MCASLCKEVNLYARQDSKLIVATPFRFLEASSLAMLAQLISTGGLSLADCGHTLIQFRYDTEIVVDCKR
jgi:hypothetical protein